MNRKKDDTAKDAARKAREARLAEALRANLRRRKAAAREPPESPPEPLRRERDGPDGMSK